MNSKGNKYWTTSGTMSFGKIKKRIQEMMGEEFAEQLSYKRENIKLKVTYELDCNSESREILYGNLVYIIDVQKKDEVEDSPENLDKNGLFINGFIERGSKLKPPQIEMLLI